MDGEFDVSVKTSASSSGDIANPTVIATCQLMARVTACLWNNGLQNKRKNEKGGSGRDEPAVRECAYGGGGGGGGDGDGDDGLVNGRGGGGCS